MDGPRGRHLRQTIQESVVTHASDIIVTGVLPRDAEASVTPKGVR